MHKFKVGFARAVSALAITAMLTGCDSEEKQPINWKSDYIEPVTGDIFESARISINNRNTGSKVESLEDLVRVEMPLGFELPDVVLDALRVNAEENGTVSLLTNSSVMRDALDAIARTHSNAPNLRLQAQEFAANAPENRELYLARDTARDALDALIDAKIAEDPVKARKTAIESTFTGESYDMFDPENGQDVYGEVDHYISTRPDAQALMQQVRDLYARDCTPQDLQSLSEKLITVGMIGGDLPADAQLNCARDPVGSVRERRYTFRDNTHVRDFLRASSLKQPGELTDQEILSDLTYNYHFGTPGIYSGEVYELRAQYAAIRNDVYAHLADPDMPLKIGIPDDIRNIWERSVTHQTRVVTEYQLADTPEYQRYFDLSSDVRRLEQNAEVKFVNNWRKEQARDILSAAQGLLVTELSGASNDMPNVSLDASVADTIDDILAVHAAALDASSSQYDSKARFILSGMADRVAPPVVLNTYRYSAEDEEADMYAWCSSTAGVANKEYCSDRGFKFFDF